MSTTTPAETALQDDISIENLKKLYGQNEVSPADVVRTVYSRISAYKDKAVWITLVEEAEAIKRAQELLKEYPDLISRPALFGIPFSVKDSIDIAGMSTTLACPTYAYTATSTAPVVQRILDAGGILIGKTNLDQFATGLNGTRSPYGIPRCVHDADYISGGSSSGSVVSVAAKLVSFTVATDTAGSTRVPGALNGVVGLKPTLGTISTVGLVPACKTADCITIIASTITSTVAALDVMQRYDADDIYARDPQQLSLLSQQPSWPSVSSPAPQSLSYGLPPSTILSNALSPTYHSLFMSFLTALPTMIPFLTPCPTFNYAPFASANAMLYDSSIVSQRLVAFAPYLATHGLKHLEPSVAAIFGGSAGFSAERAYTDLFTLAGHRRRAAEQFRSPSSRRTTAARDGSATTKDEQTEIEEANMGIDVLIVPSTATHPTVAEMQADPLELNKRLGSFTHFVNLLDLCAVAVPLRCTWRNENGREMPFGVTLIGMPGRDRDLLELGRRVMEMEL